MEASYTTFTIIEYVSHECVGYVVIEIVWHYFEFNVIF